MSPLLAYFLGFFTVLVIFIPFWYLAKVNKKVEPTYQSIFCSTVSGTGLSKSLT